jgi:hypothetical protein
MKFVGRVSNYATVNVKNIIITVSLRFEGIIMMRTGKVSAIITKANCLQLGSDSVGAII